MTENTIKHHKVHLSLSLSIASSVLPLSSHSTQWSDSHRLVGMLPRGVETAHDAAFTPVEASLLLVATGSGACI